MRKYLKSLLAGGVSAFALASAAQGAQFNIPGGDLKTALDVYAAQTSVELLYPASAVRGALTKGAKGELTASAALSRILAGTGFAMQRDQSGAVAIVPSANIRSSVEPSLKLAQAATAKAAASGIESVVVTSSKIKGDIQTVPIAVTALSQEQLTARQIAGGPDLVKEVPNLTFSKTNFTGYNIQIRGIGTQAISVTTDPAVAVAFNDMPFIRNHFFEQEFYDVGQVEVLRGPQGTLYGRNATAGVVNVVAAKPTDQFEAMVSADIGNFHNRRFEGMVNVPVVDDRLDLRFAGEWTKRDGYSFNAITNQPIDGRDLWSSRFTIGFKPSQKLQTWLVWEHFQENDDRIRSSKQLCKTDPIPTDIGGMPVPPGSDDVFNSSNLLSQGCQMSSLYTPDAFEVPNGFSLPYYGPLANVSLAIDATIDPYASTVQSTNLRVIESTLDPVYLAKNDIVEFNADYALSQGLTLSSQTGFNHDFLYSSEDYNRFNTKPGIFNIHGTYDSGWDDANGPDPAHHQITQDGYFCDPQLGCANRLVAEDLSDEHSWQLSQELRLASNFTGPFNFSAGANFLHYETEENYYVFINTLSLALSRPPWTTGVSTNSECLGNGFHYPDPDAGAGIGPLEAACPDAYIDPNPIDQVNNRGHNYFLSQNPYTLNSYAGFGEGYFNVTDDLKLIAGLRWTEDKKHFLLMPSWLLASGWGYPVAGAVNQKWGELTGRFTTNWTPKLDFTDQTLVYASYAHGYKAGGANPPGAILLEGANFQPTHPLTFAPEFIDAYELGSKNTLFDGGLTLNGNVFYYDYKGYQISYIVDRTSVNLNFDATVRGAELETTWEPTPGLKFSFAGGYEDTAIAKGSRAVDLMDRTAGNTDWIVVKPFPTQASNCVLPVYLLQIVGAVGPHSEGLCADAYVGAYYVPGGGSGNGVFDKVDPVTCQPYVPNPTFTDCSPIPAGYPGFDYRTAPNGGTGFYKDLSNNELPNAPHFTTSLTAEYTMPVSEDWAASLHGDFYWQSQSFARVFNDRPYDKLRGYSNVNLALILTSADGWQVLGYLKNIFDTTAITGDFLNSDDTGLTTNVFLTDPRLFGVRVTKNF